jgi:hypothetical protein
VAADSLTVEQSLSEETQSPRKQSWLRRTIRGFSEIDTAYVEPQHYNWAFMLQSVNTFDYYRISTSGDNEQSISFAPTLGVRVGPYFGWRWVFLGYTIDLRNISFQGVKKLEIDGSIYSAQVCADVYYRRSVNDYKIRSLNLGDDIDTSPLERESFNGLNVSITGLNLYYIFNHKRFSYPAAFAQSTCQKISCGSWMAGVGYMNNSIDFDAQRLEKMIVERLGRKVELDSGLMFNNIRYIDLNASIGYAYNWVFARNWLFCASLSMALAYKKAHGEPLTDAYKDFGPKDNYLGFNFNNFNIDGVGRFGLVWNNTRWYAGASAIVRAYNYHKSRFATNNIFGDVCIYAGINFGPRSAYKNKKGKQE